MNYTELEYDNNEELETTEEESTETVMHDEDDDMSSEDNAVITFLAAIGGAQWKEYETTASTVEEFLTENEHPTAKAVVTNRSRDILTMDTKLVDGEYYSISFANTTGGIK